MSIKDTILHQVLHGYDDGHTLLASSLDLPRSIRRKLLTLTDLSGSGISKGFEEYLTCYPLPSLGYHAIAKTWYAYEVPRPGCAWTHTLLISFSDLAVVRDLRRLTKFFRRPISRDDRSAYRLPIEASIPLEGWRSERVNVSLVRQVVDALYSNPEQPVCFFAREANAFEEAVTLVWSQQWPRLRRSFSFCTGSLGTRFLDEHPFDFQVSPIHRIREFERAVPSGVFISSKSLPRLDRSTQPDWLKIACADIVSYDNKLHEFLRKFGADVDGHRRSFRSLLQVFLAYEQVDTGHQDLESVCNLIGSSFRSPSEARKLKFFLLGPDMEGFPQSRARHDDAVVALLTTPYTSSFDFEGLRLSQRFESQLTEGVSDWKWSFLNRVLSLDLNAYGEELLDTSLEEIGGDELLEACRADRHLFEILVKRKPRKLESDEVWELPPPFQEAALHALKLADHLSLERAARLGVVMLKSQSDVVAHELHSLFGPELLEKILDSFVQTTTTPTLELCGEWRTLFAENPHCVARWIQFSKHATLTISETLFCDLSPQSPVFAGISIGRWEELAVSWRETHGEDHSQVISAAFVLAVLFANPRPVAGETVACVFPAVHEALIQSRLDDVAWEWLEVFVPHDWWFFWLEWDKAEQLRRAVVDKFLQNDWSPDSFRKIIERISMGERIVSYASGTASGRSLLRKAKIDLPWW